MGSQCYLPPDTGECTQLEPQPSRLVNSRCEEGSSGSRNINRLVRGFGESLNVLEKSLYFSGTWKVLENQIRPWNFCNLTEECLESLWISVIRNHRYHNVKLLQSVGNSPVQYNSDLSYLLNCWIAELLLLSVANFMLLAVFIWCQKHLIDLTLSGDTSLE